MRIRRLVVAVSTLVVWLPASPSAAAAAGMYSVVDLGTLGGPDSTAAAINAAGQVVGSSTTADGHEHPFLFSGGRMIDLGTLGGSDASATDINTAGQVVGQSLTAKGATHAFLWFRGRMTDLGAPSGAASWATAINDAGTIVGGVNLMPTSNSEIQAAQWRAGRITLLPRVADGGPSTVAQATDINAAGDIVGTGGGSRQILLWHNGVPTVLFATAGFTQTVGSPRINASGDVVAHWYSSHLPNAFLWRDGVARPFVLQGTAAAINDSHDFVGSFQFPPDFPGFHPYLSHGGGAMVDLTTQGIPATSSLVSINNSGRIAANLGLADFTIHAGVYLPRSGTP